ncbi:hypothetical protein [Escherichia albertii]|uniref:hypothetical protein n=1 Tax=Escherichia albertii TaxID=208962 RepID=UPI0007434937|nr:hypothetical protein [Escherichia albertii]
MRMNVFEMEGFLRGRCVPRDLKVNETNAEYLVRKFAEAEAKCAALAAENAGLKEVINEVRSIIANSHGVSGWHQNGDIAEWDEVLPEIDSVETPATDAFLAEVRAQGVEMMREHPSIKLCSLTHICDELAAQLRKGGNQ